MTLEELISTCVSQIRAAIKGAKLLTPGSMPAARHLHEAELRLVELGAMVDRLVRERR